MSQRKERIVFSVKDDRKIVWPDWYPPKDWAEPVYEVCIDAEGNEIRFWYDPETAWRWENWFPDFCTHVKGQLAKQPFELMEWLRQTVVELLGWMTYENGQPTDVRRYTTAFIFVARKNSKTLFVSGLGLGMTAIDDEPGAEVYIAASNEKQAGIGFEMAGQMVEQNEDLDAMFENLVEYIYHKESKSSLTVLSGIPKGKTGFNVHCAIIDEYHEVQDRKLISALRTGMTSRKRPLLIYTTTAGNDTTGPCYLEYQYAKKVLSGEINNPRYLPIIFEVEPKDKRDDRKAWKKANPGWGKSVNTATLEAIFYDMEKTPSEQREFDQFHLNRWHQGGQDFIEEVEWDLCLDNFDWEMMRGRPVFCGMDLSSTRDMSSAAYVFPFRQDNEVIYRVHVDYWVPSKKIKDRGKDGFRYPIWEKDGYLEKTGGNIIDYRHIRKRINERVDKYGFVSHDRKHGIEIGYDPFKATEIVQYLIEDGFKVVPVRQGGLTMGPAVSRFETLVAQKKILHNGNPILKWNVMNAVTYKDKQDNLMLDKDLKKDQIDGLVATVIALARAMVAPPPPKISAVTFV